ncbi:PD-(D/E)XK motif protein [Delftia sp. RIT313]|uniref:PD-(D/E)XK motif protein n=1 Tax=Delftia sp. RIT313 TaxID=1468410 RepID=UPI00044C6C87|nr:PD-(D/E)XK motif protein [Delftia sp. RIT313]EZP56616.1 hypothetical protein BW39_01445 [Delftia sp. RIT313]
MSNPLEQLWRELESISHRKSNGWVRRLGNPGAKVSAHVAVACPSGARSLMIDIPTAALGKLQDLPATGGLVVHLAPPLEGVAAGQRTLAVELEDAQFADIFTVFSIDLIDGISSCATAGDAIVLLFRRLERWQDFLAAAADGISQSAVIGLFGELWVLRDVLVPIGGVGMLESWTGAQRAPQDFIIPSVCAVEVKTSLSGPLTHVRIHGERQLDDVGLTCLFLLCLRVERDADAGESINKLVSDLRSLASSSKEFSILLERLLGQAGWMERHAHRYEHLRLRIAHRRAFRVSNGFPRLIQDSLRPGLSEVDYILELKACTDFECADNVFAETLSKLKLNSLSTS